MSHDPLYRRRLAQPQQPRERIDHAKKLFRSPDIPRPGGQVGCIHDDIGSDRSAMFTWRPLTPGKEGMGGFTPLPMGVFDANLSMCYL